MLNKINMKLILISILLFFSKNINCQQSNVEFFNNKLNSIYQDSTVNTLTEVAEIYYLDSFLKSIFQIRDSLLEIRFVDFIDFRMNIYHNQEFLSPLSEPESSFLNDVRNYIEYQSFTLYSYNSIPDSIIAKKSNLLLLNYHQISNDTNFIANLFRYPLNNKQKWYSYYRLYELLDSSQFTQFYYENAYYFTKDTFIFFKTVDNSFGHKKPYPMLSNTESIFIEYADTSIYNNLITYNYYFKNGQWPTDLINVEQKELAKKDEADLRNIYLQQIAIEFDSLMSLSDSLSLESLKFKCPEAYLAYQDTTLWGDNGQVPVWVGEDGMRFDTLSNDELFNLLAQINVSNVYDTVNSYLDLNSSPTVIHLRKIFQLIGDRFIYQGIMPNSSQMIQLGQIIDIYVDYIKQDTISCMHEEATLQIQRLWNLAEFKYIDWPIVNNENLNKDFSVAVDFHCTESLLLEMIRRADAYELAGNHDLAFRYIHPLMYIYNFKYIENIGYAIPPRRPFRSLEDSNRWCIDYVIPALQRYKLID